MAAGFVVPLDYAGESGIVPIFIADHDSKGNAVRRDWITEVVVPCADILRGMAKQLAHDIWCVSEITEPAVHLLSQHYPCPGPGANSQLKAVVRYNAMDLAAGGHRRRIGLDIRLPSNVNDLLVDNPLPDLEAKDAERFVRRELKDPRLVGMMTLMLQGYSQRDAARLLAGESGPTLRRLFQRRIKTLRPGAEMELE